MLGKIFNKFKKSNISLNTSILGTNNNLILKDGSKEAVIDSYPGIYFK